MRKPRIVLPEGVESALDAALDKALALQRPVVLAYLDRVRRRSPNLTPAQLENRLEKAYRRSVVGLGAASGGASALPGIGTAASVATGAAEVAAFVSATSLYVLALAELHGIAVHDPEVRRALVLGTLLGEGAVTVLEDGAVVESSHWAQIIGRSRSKEQVKGFNQRLGLHLATRFGARQGALLAGRALPFGIGAGIGAVGNAALAGGVIKTARRAFGPPPESLPGRVIDL